MRLHMGVWAATSVALLAAVAQAGQVMQVHTAHHADKQVWVVERADGSRGALRDGSVVKIRTKDGDHYLRRNGSRMLLGTRQTAGNFILREVEGRYATVQDASSDQYVRFTKVQNGLLVMGSAKDRTGFVFDHADGFPGEGSDMQAPLYCYPRGGQGDPFWRAVVINVPDPAPSRPAGLGAGPSRPNPLGGSGGSVPARGSSSLLIKNPYWARVNVQIRVGNNASAEANPWYDRGQWVLTRGGSITIQTDGEDVYYRRDADPSNPGQWRQWTHYTVNRGKSYETNLD